MDRKIKTRQVHKDIKVLDKTVTVTDHIKQSYVRTKENIMQSTEKSSVIIPGLSEPPVRTLRATIPENESHIFR